ncbi:hypothetical protein HRJ34_00095 [Rhizorhabdus wittichii]|uniref:Uncharacterized protein n=1 Tax=Rhizorhabdus wittichii TaxID=160791 RepID=A0A975D3H4_9SPHN|nr:hypothetical protein [Rhizorhabdus wittichii]QTH21979.1 hypothetical protein HRJ34_00095 [Rhizorhabdus wittichii]
MSGWYRMRRGWQTHDFFADQPFTEREAWEWLIGNAAWKDTIRRGGKGDAIPITRGQLHVSDRSLASAWQWDKKTVRRFMDRLEGARMVDQQRDHSGTIITIQNYAVYQDRGDEAGPTVPPSKGPTGDRLGDRSGDHTRRIEEEKKGKVARARARGGAEYAFMGNTVRLTAEHFNGWVAAYPHIADLRGELERIDAWWERQAPEKRDNWFTRTSGMLDKRNRENAATAQRIQSEAYRIAAEAESRRREWERKNPDLVAHYAELDALAARARAEEGSLH